MKISNENIPSCGKEIILPKLSGGGKTSEKLACRDPFILLYDDNYYLYKNFNNRLVCMVSHDLENWSEPVVIFNEPDDFHGEKDFFWAPECHYYKGNFYIFTSVFSKTYNRRVISVYRADNPLGPFVDIAGGRISPADWDAIDGTLYIDDDGNPWMVFVHEWVCMPNENGAMAAARLSEDFTHFISEPIELFLAMEPEWAVCGVTDAPFFYRLGDKLLMIWSNYAKEGYVVAVAESSNGRLDGKWIHRDHLLYCKGMRPEFKTDGGHAMIFKDRDGQMRIVMHGPNKTTKDDFEHVMIFNLVEKDSTIEIE